MATARRLLQKHSAYCDPVAQLVGCVSGVSTVSFIYVGLMRFTLLIHHSHAYAASAASVVCFCFLLRNVKPQLLLSL
jgi:hypothetical protein